MSNYKTHSAFNLLLALPVLMGVLASVFHPPFTLLITFAATFLYSTLFMSPDLDLAYQIKLTSLRGILASPFRLYSRIFKHRGLSHSVIFGSATRILWLAAIALVIFFLIYESLPSEKSLMLFFKKYKSYLLYGLAGICFSDWCHLFLDKRTQKR